MKYLDSEVQEIQSDSSLYSAPLEMHFHIRDAMEHNKSYGFGIEIIAPKQILQRPHISPALKKAGNTS